MGNNSKVLLALLAGAAAGVVIGFMLAPEKGSETRKNFKDKATKLADTLLAKAEEAIDKMTEKTTGS
jgi:gas vesicle protein